MGARHVTSRPKADSDHRPPDTAGTYRGRPRVCGKIVANVRKDCYVHIRIAGGICVCASL